jgi:dTDP-4-amino-4,6-dideoxygalactose transaminase
MKKIPFVDLKRQYKEIGRRVEPAIERVLRSARYISGPQVARFEKEFAAYCGTKFAIGVSSGSDALLLALKMLGIGKDDEVITTPFTFVSTVDTILRCGARPVFADIRPDTLNIDPEQIRSKITSKTKAVIPVHMYGSICDMSAIRSAARQHGLKIIEDACQAHGAEYRGKRSGSLGTAGCFSFYPSKNLGACGDAGMITTNSATVYRTATVLREYGQKKKYNHQLVGYNARLDEIQAAILRVKLKKLDTWNRKRRSLAERYMKGLEDIEAITLPSHNRHAIPVYHLFVIRVSGRDRLRDHLTRGGTGTGLHYPYPLHLQKAYRDLGYGKGSLPGAEKAAKRVLSLPMFPQLKKEEIDRVIGQIRTYYGK